MDFEKLLEEAAGKKLAGKKKQLQSSYDQSLADLAELEQGAAQQAREAATRRTAEAKQDRAAWNEIQTAQGLTSGAQSQALLAMDNQLRGDLTAIANTRDSATAELARKRQALARDLAQQLSGGAAVDGLPCQKPDRQVAPGAVISLRGMGKIRLAEVKGQTRKGRISVEIEKFK